MIRAVIARGAGSGDPDVLTLLELQALKKISEHGGIDKRYSLLQMGFNEASAYVIVKNLTRKGFLEEDEKGRIRPTSRASVASELVPVAGKLSACTVDAPLRAIKLGGGQIEATVTSGLFNMTLPLALGTPLWVRPREGAPVTVTFGVAQGSWGVARIQTNPVQRYKSSEKPSSF